MPARPSAGILLFRRAFETEVLLVHPGGPFWVRKDDGAWSIPKGEYEPTEDPFDAAKREFAEELGPPPPSGPAVELGQVKLTSGKVVTAWALEGDFDAASAVSNTFELAWPPGSGRIQSYPEVDRAEWFGVEAARAKLNKGQLPFLDRLLTALGTVGCAC